MTLLAASDIVAWLLRCNPGKWDLPRFIGDGNRTIRNWTISRYHDRVAAGQPVLFWVTGSAASIPTPGLWGAGVVTGPCHTDGDHGEYWLAPRPKPGSLHWLPVDITLFTAPVPRTVLFADPRLHSLEIYRTPKAGNPQRVTTDQLTVIGRYHRLRTDCTSSRGRRRRLSE
jgi:hypothetical protein